MEQQDELSQEDWKQIAFFYQKKFTELEMNVLAMELRAAKQAEPQHEPEKEL